MNWLSIVVLIFWVIMAIIGMKKGFLRMLFSMTAFILSFVLTFALYPVVNDYICHNTQAEEKIYEKYYSYIEKKEKENTLENKESFVDKLSNSLMENGDAGYLDDVTKLIEQSTIETGQVITNVTSELMQSLAAKLALVTIKVLSFLITWIIISIALAIVTSIIKIIEKLPVIKGANRLLGFALGTIYGLLIIWVFFVIVTALAATNIGTSCLNCISQSEFLSLLYKGNIFLKFF